MNSPDTAPTGPAVLDSATTSKISGKSFVFWIAFICFPTIFLALTLFAYQKRIFYFDAVANVYTGFSLIQGKGVVSIYRTPLLPLIYSVFFAMGISLESIMTALGCMGVGVTLAWAYCSLSFFRQTFEQHLSLLLLVLLVSNRVVLHYASALVSDFPAALTVAAAFLCYQKAISNKSPWYMGLSGILLGIGIAFRYNVVLFVGIFAIAFVLRTF